MAARGAGAESGRTYRLGFAIPVGRDLPAISAFFDELRLAGFIEGQYDFTVTPGKHLEGLQSAARARYRTFHFWCC